jgi:hypothetical protein
MISRECIRSLSPLIWQLEASTFLMLTGLYSMTLPKTVTNSFTESVGLREQEEAGNP